MLENRINELGLRYSYHRKRKDEGKIVSPFHIFMTKLAHIYYVCEYKKPDEGISGQIEQYFSEEKRYNDAFPANQIKKTLGINLDHIIFKYIDSWSLNFIMDRSVLHELNKKSQAFYQYIKWYVLIDLYNQLQNWKEKVFEGTWREWTEFIDSSEYLNAIIKYARYRYPIYLGMLPKSESEPRNFYKSTEGRNKFEKNYGNFNRFKGEINKAYVLFRKHYSY